MNKQNDWIEFYSCIQWKLTDHHLFPDIEICHDSLRELKNWKKKIGQALAGTEWKYRKVSCCCSVLWTQLNWNVKPLRFHDWFCLAMDFEIICQLLWQIIVVGVQNNNTWLQEVWAPLICTWLSQTPHQATQPCIYCALLHSFTIIISITMYIFELPCNFLFIRTIENTCLKLSTRGRNYGIANMALLKSGKFCMR